MPGRPPVNSCLTMPVERQATADGGLRIVLTSAEDGEVDAILVLPRPTYHVVYRAHLEAAQAEVRALESGPREDTPVLPFRRPERVR